MSREGWLNGHRRESDRVLVFPHICCAGCGVALDVVCYVPGTEDPAPAPSWPFEEDGCPVCRLRARAHPEPPRDKLMDRMIALRAAAPGVSR